MGRIAMLIVGSTIVRVKSGKHGDGVVMKRATQLESHEVIGQDVQALLGFLTPPGRTNIYVSGASAPSVVDVLAALEDRAG
jgi:hypothetical protein